MNVVTVLKSGGDFKPQHAQALSRQVPNLICLTDMEVGGVDCIRLRNDFKGWWSKLNLFDPNQIEGDVLFFDLDTVILGSIEDMVFDRSMCLRGLGKPQTVESGVLFIKEEDKAPIFESFLRNQKPMRQYQPDAVILEQHRERFGIIQDALPGKISSYKIHIRKGNPLTDVICFHGSPRPWDITEEWIPDYGI